MSEESEGIQPSQLTTIPIGKLFSTIEICYRAGINLVVYGPPGCGKTQIAKQAAAQLELTYAEMLLAGRDIGDVFMPYVEPGQGLTFHYNTALPVKGNQRFEGKGTLLNIDEFSGAKPMMQNVLLKTLDEHKIGEVSLRDDVWIMATGNRSWDLAHTEQVSAALANRAAFVQVEHDLQAFLHYGVAHNFHPLVLAWVRLDEENLFSFNPEAFLAGDYAFPSSRANERLSNLMHTKDKYNPDDDVMRSLYCGTIGQSRGVKFSGFIKIANEMPDFDAILNGGARQPVPTDPAVAYATLYALVQKVERSSVKHATDYVARFEPEWSQMFITAVTKAKPQITANAAWGSFVAAHSNDD